MPRDLGVAARELIILMAVRKRQMTSGEDSVFDIKWPKIGGTR